MTTAHTPSLAPAAPPTLSSADLDVAAQLAETNRKLDILVQQVGHLHQRYQAMEELKDELLRIGRDVMAGLTVELAAVEHEFNGEAIVHLLRTLIRSTPRLTRMLEQLATLHDLGEELGPISKEVMRDLTERLADWEQRGYFRLLKGGLELADRLASKTSQRDIDDLVDNIDLIVDAIKQTTQPKVLHVAEHAVAALDPGQAQPLGVWGLMRALRDPEIQQGVGVALAMLREVARAQTHQPGE